jgi:hypothetical protein
LQLPLHVLLPQPPFRQTRVVGHDLIHRVWADVQLDVI